MPLSADQKATLQLVLQRDQSYADLSDLLDVEEAEVRERARSALHELGGADPDRNVALTDYLLGQSDPISRADAVRHLRKDPADHRLATELVAELREVVPGAELPRLPGEPRSGRFLRRSPAGPGKAPPTVEDAGPRSGIGTRLSPGQSRLLVGLGAAAVLLIAVVLGVAGAFGGADDDGAAPTEVGNGIDEEVTRVALSPPNGGNASGEAVFGLTSADTVFVDLDINGLEPAPEDQTHVLWLMATRQRGYPLAPIVVAPNQTFQERFAIPSAVLPLVARVRFVEVTTAPNEQLARGIQRAQRATQDATEITDLLIEAPGRTVLQGAVPLTEAPPGEEPDGEGDEAQP